jgi:hypothetical protein
LVKIRSDHVVGVNDDGSRGGIDLDVLVSFLDLENHVRARFVVRVDWLLNGVVILVLGIND